MCATLCLCLAGEMELFLSQCWETSGGSYVFSISYLFEDYVLWKKLPMDPSSQEPSNTFLKGKSMSCPVYTLLLPNRTDRALLIQGTASSGRALSLTEAALGCAFHDMLPRPFLPIDLRNLSVKRDKWCA